MRKIKINFVDFWGGFDKTNNYFYNLLKEEFEIEISDNPDYLFYSLFGNDHLNYKCIKISYHGENIPPMFIDSLNIGEGSHWSFSFDKINDNRNYRLPHYLLYDGYYELERKSKIEDWMFNRNFCNFVASNPNSQDRNQFVEKLSKYKKVDSGGRWMNNIGFAVKDKRQFQSQYKFSIAFENNAYRPGYEWYITEKIMEPMTVNSIPIYKGGSKINEDFNTQSFINWHNYNNDDEVIEKIIELDKDKDKYLSMLNESWFPDKEIPDNNKEENIKEFLYNIFK